MLRKVSKISMTLCFICLVQLGVKAQVAQNGDWMRVQSDDGEFSIEIPVQYNYFYQKDGFETGFNETTYKLKDMNLVNSYSNGTLLSIETYEAKKGAINALANAARRDVKLDDIEFNGIKAREITKKTDDFLSITRYFYSKTHIYVLMAASRSGQTSAMKRFFESANLRAGALDLVSGARAFSSLDISTVNIKTKGVTPPPVPLLGEDANKITNKTTNIDGLIIVSKPIPTYTDNARIRGTQGTIQVRVKFASSGFIPSIEVIKELPNGLLRQVIFAVVRIKFLPSEEKGKSIDLEKIVEYGFSIY